MMIMISSFNFISMVESRSMVGLLLLRIDSLLSLIIPSTSLTSYPLDGPFIQCLDSSFGPSNLLLFLTDGISLPVLDRM